MCQVSVLCAVQGATTTQSQTTSVLVDSGRPAPIATSDIARKHVDIPRSSGNYYGVDVSRFSSFTGHHWTTYNPRRWDICCSDVCNHDRHDRAKQRPRLKTESACLMMYAKASSDDTAKHKKCINNAKIMQNQSRKKCTENAKTSHQRMPWNAKKKQKKCEKNAFVH